MATGITSRHTSALLRDVMPLLPPGAGIIWDPFGLSCAANSIAVAVTRHVHGSRRGTEDAPLCKRVAVGRRPAAGVVGRANTRARVVGGSIDSYTLRLSPHTRAERGPDRTPASRSASSARPL